jgi:hypothetical protein
MSATPDTCSPGGPTIGSDARRHFLRRAALAVWLAAACFTTAAAQESDAGQSPTGQTAPTGNESKFRSPEDGWLDVSGFLDKPYGFFPILVPITEPAVGYGAAGGLAFIQKNPGENRAGFGRPDMSMVGGLATQNDTWGLVAGDLRHWHGDRLETFVAVVKASINLDFYGTGEDSALRDDPLAYNLEPLGGLVRGRYRIGASRVWAGLAYVLADIPVNFEAPSTSPGIPDTAEDTRVGGITPALTFDSRDNMFTPNRGTFFEGSVSIYDETLGGDEDFQRLDLIAIHYWRLKPTLILGLRGNGSFSSADTPFYMRPFISLRGVAMLRYQGEEVAEIETEARWQFWKRFSLVGFAGTGAAWNDLESFDDTLTVVTGGTGFRYEIARRYGLHVGLDVAFGPDNPVLYVVFGSAWLRP